MALVTAIAQWGVDVQNAILAIPGQFDVDVAVGVNLDIVGLWIGVGRKIATPISGVYFSFNIDGLGFNQGVWKGEFDPDTGLTSLDDETYRLLLRAKIGANHWDGTLGASKAILDSIFANITATGTPYDSGGFGEGPYGGESGSTILSIKDNQDMTMTIVVSGVPPSALFLALLTGGYIPIKPAGVTVDYDIPVV